jgi:hypothetical protein
MRLDADRMWIVHLAWQCAVVKYGWERKIWFESLNVGLMRPADGQCCLGSLSVIGLVWAGNTLKY